MIEKRTCWQWADLQRSWNLTFHTTANRKAIVSSIATTLCSSVLPAILSGFIFAGYKLWHLKIGLSIMIVNYLHSCISSIDETAKMKGVCREWVVASGREWRWMQVGWRKSSEGVSGAVNVNWKACVTEPCYSNKQSLSSCQNPAISTSWYFYY